MSNAPAGAEFYILTQEEYNAVIALDSQNPALAGLFTQFAELGSDVYCIRKSDALTYDDHDNDPNDFTEDLWMEFNSQYFILSTMHPIQN